MKTSILKSFTARISIGVFLTCMTCLIVVTGFHLFYTYQAEKRISLQNLNSQIKTLTADYNSRINTLRKDVTFLSSVPPVKGIIKASQSNDKKVEKISDLAKWKEQLKVIFKEMLIAKPEYLQIRLIGKKDEGKELVRVDWIDRRLRILTENKLQQKGSETYFKEAMTSPPWKVYLSEFTLNREWGKVVKPPQLVIRAAVPILDEKNNIFGIVIINMLAEKALAGLLESHKSGSISGLYNSNLEPLITSSKNKGWLITENNSLTSEKIKEIFKNAGHDHPIVRGDINNHLIMGKKIFYDPLAPDRFLAVTISTSNQKILSEVIKELIYQSFLVLILLAFAMALLIFSIKKQTAPLKSLRKLTLDLSSGVKLTKLEGLKDKDDELSSLILLFYKMADEIEHKTAILNLQKQALDETALVSETDPRGRITYANHKFAKVSGFTQDMLIGSDHRIINSGYHSADFFRDLWSTISQGKPWRGEIKNKRKDGSFYWVDTSIVPFKNSQGQVQRYISIRFDITEQKKQEKALIELTKSKFLAVMSHEIRTPLGAVIGLSELLAATQLNSEQKSYVNSIENSAEILLNILNDILDLTKLDSGKIELNLEPTNLKDSALNITSIFKEKAIEKGIELVCHTSDKVPYFVDLDSVRVKQILINLISNAVKFTDHGIVSLKIDYSKEKEILIIEVKDSGIGMTSEQLEKAFNEFEQAESSTTKKYGGTGLGLPICQKIVNALQGKISAQSELGKGSIFKVELPAKNSTNHVILNKESSKLNPINIGKDVRVLLAEDNSLNQTIFSKMMKHYGISVKIVDNGLKALTEIENSNYDLIFLDIQMPIMDGIEACKLIRVDQNKKKLKPWVVAITANTFQDDINKYKESGFDDFAAKPFTKKTLGTVLSNFISKTGRFHS